MGTRFAVEIHVAARPVNPQPRDIRTRGSLHDEPSLRRTLPSLQRPNGKLRVGRFAVGGALDLRGAGLNPIIPGVGRGGENRAEYQTHRRKLHRRRASASMSSLSTRKCKRCSDPRRVEIIDLFTFRIGEAARAPERGWLYCAISLPGREFRPRWNCPGRDGRPPSPPRCAHDCRCGYCRGSLRLFRPLRVAQRGVAFARLVARTTESNTLIEQHVVADFGGLADTTPMPWSMKKRRPMVAPGEFRCR